MRILKNRRICCINIGENYIFTYKQGEISDGTEERTTGKLGLFKITEEDIDRRLKFTYGQFYPGDKIFVCTDGRVDYDQDSPDSEPGKPTILKALNSIQGINEVVKEVNQQILTLLRISEHPNLRDDYTIMGIEFK